MTKTELAKQIGISRELLHRHIKRGCPVDSLESALLWREKNLDLTQTKIGRITGNNGGKKSESDSQVNDSEIISSDLAELVHKVTETQLDLETTDADILFKNARALKEKSAALQIETERQKYIGELVLKSDVERVIFERARQFRDGLMSCSRRISPELSGITNIREIESALTREFRFLLEGFANLPPVE